MTSMRQDPGHRPDSVGRTRGGLPDQGGDYLSVVVPSKNESASLPALKVCAPRPPLRRVFRLGFGFGASRFVTLRAAALKAACGPGRAAGNRRKGIV